MDILIVYLMLLLRFCIRRRSDCEHSDLGFVHLIELSLAAMERDGAVNKINTHAAKNP
jgi:hypothetical protein